MISVRLSHNVIVLASISLSALLLSCGAFLGTWWWINTMEQKLLDTRVSAKQTEEEQKQFASLEKLALDTAEDRARLESYIVPEQNVIEFLSTLEGVVRARGATPEVRSINTQPHTNQNIVEELVVTMGISGSSEKLTQALRAIERMPYQIRIENLSMRGSREAMRADAVVIVTKATPVTLSP